jgi:hypothetical protein
MGSDFCRHDFSCRKFDTITLNIAHRVVFGTRTSSPMNMGWSNYTDFKNLIAKISVFSNFRKHNLDYKKFNYTIG